MTHREDGILLMKAKWSLGFKWGWWILLSLLTVEAVCQVRYRMVNGKWYLQARRDAPRGMLQLHPYFGLSLVPNLSVERKGIRLSHNSFGYRGPEFARPKPPGRIRVAALGGSSTYCAGVSDEQTWPYLLGAQLGAGYEVVNLGVPSYSSLEASLQSALLFSDVRPDIALYYLGWNDLQVQHVKNLMPDWSDSHGKMMLATALGSRELEERTATGYSIKRVLFHSFFPGMDTDLIVPAIKGTPDAFTDRIDERALGQFERNARNIVALCRRQGVKPVFVPQLLNYQALTKDKPYGWILFVRDRDLKTVMGAYNEALARVAKEEGAEFLGEVLEQPFGGSDFIDQGHFSEAGNRRFAQILAGCLKRAGN